MKRSSEAVWSGDLKNGNGTVKLGSGAFTGPYSFNSRFEDGGDTNPEELVAAAHAGCYSMALASALSTAGHIPESVQTTAMVHLEKSDDGMGISRIELSTRVVVSGVDESTFQKLAEEAKNGCIISRALSAVPIELDATIDSGEK